MAKHARFHIVYDGPALQQSRMDVRDLAPALLAVGDLVDRANELLNGDRAKVSVQVNSSFKTGSFGIDMQLVQSLWQHAMDFGNSGAVTGMLNIAGLVGLGSATGAGLIGVVKWLRGRKITRVIELSDGKVTILVDEARYQTEQAVLMLLRDYRMRQHLEQLIAKPLEKEGVDTFAIAEEDVKSIAVTVEKGERQFFYAPTPEDEYLDSAEYETNVQLVNISFKDNNMWRLSDGASEFHARMADQEFNDRVATNREAFARDDILRVRMRKTQKQVGGSLRTEYEVLKVLLHRSIAPQVQISLPFDAGSE